MKPDPKPIAPFTRDHGEELLQKGQLYVGLIGIWMVNQREWYIHGNGTFAWNTPKGAHVVMRRYARHNGDCMLAPIAIDMIVTVGRRKIPDMYSTISRPDEMEKYEGVAAAYGVEV